MDNSEDSGRLISWKQIVSYLGRDSEKFYILFPRTDVDLIAHPVEAICRIDILKNGCLPLSTAISKIIYILSPELSLENAVFSHGLQQLHKEGVLAGKIKSTLDEDSREKLKHGVLYYDGHGWVSKPTPCQHLGEGNH